MTTETMGKKINAKQKEIAKYQKEIAKNNKHYSECVEEAKDNTEIAKRLEMIKADAEKWNAYYRNLIEKCESEIAQMTKEAIKVATEEYKKMMISAKAEDMAKNGFKPEGYTVSGLRYGIIKNCFGTTQRSAHCYSMWIEGKGTQFTSGTLETVAEYILNN